MANSMLYACTTKLVERRKTMTVDGYRLPERTCRLYPDLRCIRNVMSSAMAFLSWISTAPTGDWRTMCLRNGKTRRDSEKSSSFIRQNSCQTSSGILIVTFIVSGDTERKRTLTQVRSRIWNFPLFSSIHFLKLAHSGPGVKELKLTRGEEMCFALLVQWFLTWGA